MSGAQEDAATAAAPTTRPWPGGAEQNRARTQIRWGNRHGKEWQYEEEAKLAQLLVPYYHSKRGFVGVDWYKLSAEMATMNRRSRDSYRRRSQTLYASPERRAWFQEQKSALDAITGGGGNAELDNRSRRISWTPEENQRLVALRKAHPRLEWQEFAKKFDFNGRSASAVARQHFRFINRKKAPAARGDVAGPGAMHGHGARGAPGAAHGSRGGGAFAVGDVSSGGIVPSRPGAAPMRGPMNVMLQNRPAGIAGMGLTPPPATAGVMPPQAVAAKAQVWQGPPIMEARKPHLHEVPRGRTMEHPGMAPAGLMSMPMPPGAPPDMHVARHEDPGATVGRPLEIGARGEYRPGEPPRAWMSASELFCADAFRMQRVNQPWLSAHPTTQQRYEMLAQQDRDRYIRECMAWFEAHGRDAGARVEEIRRLRDEAQQMGVELQRQQQGHVAEMNRARQNAANLEARMSRLLNLLMQRKGSYGGHPPPPEMLSEQDIARYLDQM